MLRVGIAYLATIQRLQLPGGSISDSGELGAFTPCIDWLQAAEDSRPGSVRLEWRSSGANHVLIGGKVFAPDGTARVRLAPRGWIAVTPVSLRPRRAGLSRYVFLVPRCEMQRPLAALAVSSARIPQVAPRSSPRRAAWATLPSRSRRAPDGPRFSSWVSRWGGSFERYAGRAYKPLILVPDVTERAAHERGERSWLSDA